MQASLRSNYQQTYYDYSSALIGTELAAGNECTAGSVSILRQHADNVENASNNDNNNNTDESGAINPALIGAGQSQSIANENNCPQLAPHNELSLVYGDGADRQPYAPAANYCALVTDHHTDQPANKRNGQHEPTGSSAINPIYEPTSVAREVEPVQRYPTSSCLEQQPSFNQPRDYEHQHQHQHQPAIYQADRSVYYDLSSSSVGSYTTGSYVNSGAQEQQHSHQLKLIELQETYHQEPQRANTIASSSSPTVGPLEQQQLSHQPAYNGLVQDYQQPLENQAHYAPPAMSSYQVDMVAQQGVYCHSVRTTSAQTCYGHLIDRSGSYYEPLEMQPAGSAVQQQHAGLPAYGQEIEYHQLEDSRKQHEQLEQQYRAHHQHLYQQAPVTQCAQPQNSYSSAVASSPSSSAKSSMFSHQDEDDDHERDEEPEDEEEEEDDDLTDDGGESEDSMLPRDEKRAREANIPLSYHEIVNLSIDQFNEHIAQFHYTEAQLTLMKDIRRRGKNKVAAQTCRKRKMEQIMELQQEVGQLANKRMSLSCDLNRLVHEHMNQVKEYERLYSIIENHMAAENGARLA